MCTASYISQNAINKIEPPNWWVNMNNSNFQLMLHGDDLARGELNIANPKIKVKKTSTFKNPNYLFVDIEILDNSVPFYFVINFLKDGINSTYNYKLLDKKNRVNSQSSFNSSDVIYLITPDRFANGDSKNDINKDLLEKRIMRKKPNARHGGDILGIINHLDYI